LRPTTGQPRATGDWDENIALKVRSSIAAALRNISAATSPRPPAPAKPDDLLFREPACLYVHPPAGDGLYSFLEELAGLRSMDPTHFWRSWQGSLAHPLASFIPDCPKPRPGAALRGRVFRQCPNSKSSFHHGKLDGLSPAPLGPFSFALELPFGDRGYGTVLGPQPGTNCLDVTRLQPCTGWGRFFSRCGPPSLSTIPVELYHPNPNRRCSTQEFLGVVRCTRIILVHWRYGDLTNLFSGYPKPNGYLSSHNVNYGFTRRDTGDAK
jgi:hypothetical protein